MNVRSLAAALSAAFILAFAASRAHADDDRTWTGNLNFTGGIKMLENDWKPADDETVFGVEGDIRQESWPFNIMASFDYGKSDKEEVTIPSGGTVTAQSITDEVDLGLRKYFETGNAWRPFISGGLAILGGELKTRGPISSTSDSDTAVGGFASLGVVATISDILNAGVQTKFSNGKVDLNGVSLNAGGFQFNAMLGVHF